MNHEDLCLENSHLSVTIFRAECSDVGYQGSLNQRAVGSPATHHQNQPYPYPYHTLPGPPALPTVLKSSFGRYDVLELSGAEAIE